MRLKGTLVKWDDAKGYGFIAPDEAGPKVFVHISALRLRATRPQIGERFSYVEGVDAQGKRRAQDLKSLAPRPAAKPAQPPAPKAAPDPQRVLLLIPLFASLVLAIHLVWPLPTAVLGAYSTMSTASFLVYYLDKRAARRQQRRVPERSLLLLSLCCGWPGALLAQQLLAHKRSKPAFRRQFWGTVALNILFFVLLFTPALNAWFPSR